MTNKTTKRALITSVMAMLLCFAMMLGTTFAWFTDSAASGSNVITAGNLDVVVEYTLDGENWNDLDGATDLFQKGLWEPGHTEVVALRITNNGSLALKYTANMNIASETIGKTKDGADIVLSDILTVDSIIMDTGAMGDVLLGVAFGDESTLQYTNTASFKNANVLGADEMLLPGTSKYLIVKVDMADAVANEANHNGTDIPSINFGINILATQFTYENDSFGNQYDKDAFVADVYVTTVDELLESITGDNKVIGMMADITVGSDKVGSNGYGKTGISLTNGQTLDGNGNSIGVDAWGTWDTAINTTGGVIKNVTVSSGMRGIFVNHNSAVKEKVILENVIIDGTVYTISCDQGTNSGLDAKNCTFNGWTSYAATIGDVSFVDCSFGEGQGYAFCRPYAPTAFVGCDFEAGFVIDARAAVTFENCTIGGVALTADNLSTLVTSNISNAMVK